MIADGPLSDPIRAPTPDPAVVRSIRSFAIVVGMGVA